MSSTCFATLVYLSHTNAPDFTYCLNEDDDFISGPGLPLKSSMEIFLPLFLSSSGLGSNRSTALGAPSMNSQMTDLAFGAKCGGRTASGLMAVEISVAEAGVARRSASARSPKPAPARVMNSRRVVGRANRPQDWLRLVHIDELVEAKDRLAEISHCFELIFVGGKRIVAISAPLKLAIDESNRRLPLGLAGSPA